MNIPFKDNKRLEAVVKLVNENEELTALFEACNGMAVKRLGMTDHGLVHSFIVANIALKLLRNLVASGVTPSIVKDFDFSNDDAEVVVVLASLMHDAGNAVHRDLHDNFGVLLVKDFLEQILSKVYGPREKIIMTTEIMSAMVSHSEEIKVFTLEGGIVRLADGLDMEKGRARIAFELGERSIHSVSAMSIDKVSINSGKKPIMIEISMNNSAGIFQVDYLLKKKLKGSGLERYTEIKAIVSQNEEKIVTEYKME